MAERFLAGTGGVFLIGKNLDEFALTDDSDSHIFEVFADLFFQIGVLESIWVDPGHIFGDLRISLILIDVLLLFGNGKSDALGLNAAVEETLNESKCVQRAAVYNDVGLTTAVSQLAHELLLFSQEPVKVGVINANESTASAHTFR